MNTVSYTTSAYTESLGYAYSAVRGKIFGIFKGIMHELPTTTLIHYLIILYIQNSRYLIKNEKENDRSGIAKYLDIFDEEAGWHNGCIDTREGNAINGPYYSFWRLSPN